jgi:hypothetical protein
MSEATFRLEQLLKEEIAIVNRVWRAVGIDTYELANGLSIDEIVAKIRRERDAAESALIGHGYIKSCSVPACNCGDRWSHGGHCRERLGEIYDALGELTNGMTALDAIKLLVSQAQR